MNVLTTHLQFRCRYIIQQTHKYPDCCIYIFLYWSSSHLLFKKTFLYRWSIAHKLLCCGSRKHKTYIYIYQLWQPPVTSYNCVLFVCRYVNLVTFTINIYHIYTYSNCFVVVFSVAYMWSGNLPLLLLFLLSFVEHSYARSKSYIMIVFVTTNFKLIWTIVTRWLIHTHTLSR